MSVEASELMGEVWTRWQGHVINGMFPLGRFLGCSDHSGVFLTHSAAHGADFAIKLVPTNRTLAESQLPRWKRAGSLAHPHLLRPLEWGGCQLDGLPYLYFIMEYADQTLAQLLLHRALTEDEAREMLLPILDALAFLHGRNLVQGQLKPANILVVGDQLKLASDTLRRFSDGTNAPTVYDPPEAEPASSSAAGDVWALGVSLFEAATRRPPTGLGEPGDAVALLPDFSAEFREVVAACLSASPRDRPTVAQLATWALGAAAQSAPPTDVPPEPSQPPESWSPESAPPPEAATPEEPTPEEPTPEEPTPEEPTPEEPTSEASTSEEPASDALTSDALTSEEPTPEEPTSETPTSEAPTSEAPTSQAPKCAAPTLAVPTLATPTPAVPARAAPTYAARTSAAPSPAGPTYAARTSAAPAPAGPTYAARTSVAPVPATSAPAADMSAADMIAALESAVPTPVAHEASEPDASAAESATPRTLITVGFVAVAILALAWTGLRALRTHHTPATGPPAVESAGAAPLQTPGAAAPTTAEVSPPLAAGSITRPGRSDEATTRAAPVAVMPDVPHSALRTVHGRIKVWVRVIVDQDGSVFAAVVDRAGSSRYFQRLAVEAAKKWTFPPADSPSERLMQIRFEFSREGATGHAVALH